MAVKFQRLSSIPLERKDGQDAGGRSDWDGSAFSRHRPPARDGASRAHPEPALLGLDQKGPSSLQQWAHHPSAHVTQKCLPTSTVFRVQFKVCSPMRYLDGFHHIS